LWLYPNIKIDAHAELTLIIGYITHFIDLRQRTSAAIPKIRRTGKLCRKRSNMPLTIPELRTAASFLRQARVLVESMKDFFRGYDADTTARLGDIATRLNDEREYRCPAANIGVTA
jgi:hypothetical protein